MSYRERETGGNTLLVKVFGLPEEAEFQCVLPGQVERVGRSAETAAAAATAVAGSMNKRQVAVSVATNLAEVPLIVQEIAEHTGDIPLELVLLSSTNLEHEQRSNLRNAYLSAIIAHRVPIVMCKAVMAYTKGYPTSTDQFLQLVASAIKRDVVFPSELDEAVEYVGLFMEDDDRVLLHNAFNVIRAKLDATADENNESRLLRPLQDMFSDYVQSPPENNKIPFLQLWGQLFPEDQGPIADADRIRLTAAGEAPSDSVLAGIIGNERDEKDEATAFLAKACWSISPDEAEKISYAELATHVQMRFDAVKGKGPLEACKVVRHALMVVGDHTAAKKIRSVRALGQKLAPDEKWTPKGLFSDRLASNSKHCKELTSKEYTENLPRKDKREANRFLATVYKAISLKGDESNAVKLAKYVQIKFDSAPVFEKGAALEVCKMVRHALSVVGANQAAKEITSVRSFGKEGSVQSAWQPKGSFAIRLKSKRRYCRELMKGPSKAFETELRDMKKQPERALRPRGSGLFGAQGSNAKIAPAPARAPADGPDNPADTDASEANGP